MRFFVRTLFLLCFSVIFCAISSPGQNTTEQNQTCLKCHASQTYTLYNDWTEKEEKRLMNPFYILDTVQLAGGVHHAFNCIDCHSMDYETYPHDSELKLEPMMTCIDCHGGDPTYQDWQFDRIEEEFHKSVHYETHGDQFSCSKCHNQHYYRPTARNSNSIREIVNYSNEMCLSCHDNMTMYQLVSDSTKPKLVDVHSWLPNQELHFKRVRCIECHTEVQDSLMVSHNILKKELATRNCVECHSSNSILQASLYKYQNLKTRSEDGENSQKSILGLFTINRSNKNLSNTYYVIGASRVPYLNTIFAIIFFAAVGGIAVHTILRILKK
ncbi:Cytochrome c3 [Mariniphaga anaerophila]|uniref:Cytochrome c3 n=1 Tax=Mariniphaga anaerophila TaxID=1484053 RepID=A0A1M5CVC6_9BACT|nr:cytochrome c3 family protein [Mariniphaga anaerophila]SHF58639.1 Cytochrome c3 [Mariniphaga anaerophila]